MIDADRAAAFLRCSNLTAANTTPGTSAVIYGMIVPPTAGGFVDTEINFAFDTALTCWIVLGEAESDVAEVAANDVGYNIRYR